MSPFTRTKERAPAAQRSSSSPAGSRPVLLSSPARLISMSTSCAFPTAAFAYVDPSVMTYTIQALAQAGEHIVAQKTIYGGSYNLLAHTLPQYGITATFVDRKDRTLPSSS